MDMGKPERIIEVEPPVDEPVELPPVDEPERELEEVPA